MLSGEKSNYTIFTLVSELSPDRKQLQHTPREPRQRLWEGSARGTGHSEVQRTPPRQLAQSWEC